jgi:hypothetical protein
MLGDQQAVRGEIKTLVSHMLRGVPKENTVRNRGELTGSGGRGVRVSGASEDPEVGIGGSGVEKGKVG